MRPRRLTLEAFGSYGKRQVIDFLDLGDQRLFLIWGPTGAGKTTLFDAICYALYGVSSAGEREATQMRSDVAPAQQVTEVSFEFGLGDHIYRVRRSPRQQRAKQRGEGSMVAEARAQLWQLGGGSEDDPEQLLAGSVRAVTERIEQLLGFRAEQFRQVVLLPQGRFERLLKATSHERQRLLDSLFDTSVYARIEELLRRSARDAARDVEQLRTQQQTILREAAQPGAPELEQQIAQLTARGRELDGELTQLRQTIAATEEALRLTERAAELRGALDRARAELTEHERQLEHARGAFERADAQLTAQRAHEPRARELQRDLQRAQQIEQQLAQLRQSDDEVKASEQQLDGLSERLHQQQAQLERLASEQRQLAEAVRGGDELAVRLERDRLGWEAAQQQRQQREELQQLTPQLTSGAQKRDEIQESIRAVEQRRDDARARLDRLEAAWLSEQASAIASDLHEGAPCPVCGSLEHPHPARAGQQSVAVDELKAARAQLRQLAAQRDQLVARLHQLETDTIKAKTRAEGLVELLGLWSRQPVEELQRQAEQQLGRLRETERAQRQQQALATQLEQLDATVESKQQAVAELSDERRRARDLLQQRRLLLDERRKGIPPHLRQSEAVARAITQLKEQLGQLTRELSAAQGDWQEAHTRLAVARDRGAAAQRAVDELEGRVQQAEQELARGQSDSTSEDASAAALRRELERLRRARDEATAEQGRTGLLRRELAARLERLIQTSASLEQADAHYGRIGRLANAATGRNSQRMTLQRFVLASLLEDVLIVASERLRRMTRGRFSLHRAVGSRGGLDLEVSDSSTGTVRSPVTLSGGETFLASLALALGLADVVQANSGGVRLDTVFIDEGFGGLDPEALEQALVALTDLQRTGKQVGIISHVPELRERISARLEVTPGPSGSKAQLVLP